VGKEKTSDSEYVPIHPYIHILMESRLFLYAARPLTSLFSPSRCSRTSVPTTRTTNTNALPNDRPSHPKLIASTLVTNLMPAQDHISMCCRHSDWRLCELYLLYLLASYLILSFFLGMNPIHTVNNSMIPLDDLVILFPTSRRECIKSG